MIGARSNRKLPTFAWRFIDLGERRLAITSPFGRQLEVRPAGDVARAFHALPPEPAYPRAGGGETLPPPGGLALFEDTCSLGGGILIAAKGGAVAESLVGVSESPKGGLSRREPDGALSLRLWPLTPMRRWTGDFIFLRQTRDEEDAVWLLELLPRLAIAARFCDLSQFKIVVSQRAAGNPQLVRDSLGLFGVRPERVLAIGPEPAFFQRLLFPMPVAHHPSGKSPGAMEVLEYLPARFPAAPDAPERIFVTGRLPAADEERLLHILQPWGFAPLDPARLDFSERARTFSRARWIVSGGGGLANAAFAPRGVTLVQAGLTPGAETYFRDLADVKQGRFVLLPHPGDAKALQGSF